MIDNEIQAVTEPGRRLVAIAEQLAPGFATRAPVHDREGSFSLENLSALKETNYLYAPVPEHLGGMGAESVHDVLVASSRLARGDASITLGVNMHLITLMSYARQLQVARFLGDATWQSRVEAIMGRIVEERHVIAAAVSEPDQNLLAQQTRATRNGHGWILNGRKIFTSMAPAATHMTVALGYRDDDGEDRHAYSIVPTSAPGVTVNDDWDALGMRASGSVSVTFEDTPIGERLGRGVRGGVLTPEYMELVLTSGPAHASASVGIAETAQRLAVEAVCSRLQRSGQRVRPTVQHLAAESSVDIAAIRAIFSRALLLIDRYNEEHLSKRGTMDEVNAVFSEAQRAKAFINQAAVRVVDRAMTMTGGGAYTSGHPLSRLYRDARAGAFMNPLSASVAYEYFGAVALGLRPETL